MKYTIQTLYEKMLAEMGPQGWWPADTKIEVAIGAILVQNTNWRNVARSLAALRKETALEPQRILRLSKDKLIELIRPSGFYKNKSRSLLALLAWLAEEDFDYAKIKRKFGDGLRKELLALYGIGEETADVLLVYVFDEAEFIADRYAQRLMAALGLQRADSYRKLKEEITLPAGFGYQAAQEFHGLIDNFGKHYLKHPADFANSFLADATLEY
ncbi:deoxyribonuclease I [Enterococcus hirae]|nr:deoxyribonuclease I [Enterococcus hirae]